MHFLQEIICSTTFVVGAISCLLLALAITSFRLLVVNAERQEAQLLADECTAQKHEATHQLKQLLGSIQAQIWFLDTQTRVVSYNDFTKEFLGVDALQVRGRPMMALLPTWHDPESAQSRNERVIHTGEAILGTIESYEQDGKTYWSSVDRLPSYDAQGNLDGLRVFCYDITPQRALINSLPDLLFRVNRNGTLIDYQGNAAYSPRLAPERFLGHNITEIFDPVTIEHFQQKFQRARQSNQMQIHEHEMPMSDGTVRNWEQRIVATGNDEILLIMRDISSRKQAEEALRSAHADLEQRVQERTAELQRINERLQQEVEERYRVEEALRSSEERLGMALIGADLGLIDIDLQTGKAVYNERWAEIRGYPLDQYFDTMRTWKDSIHPDDRPVVSDVLENHLSGETPFFDQEYRVRRSDGTWRWVRCRGKIVSRTPEGQPLRFAGTQTDITEYKQLEQQLLHAQKMDAVGRLAGGVAHDFNNILTVIMSYSELVLLQVEGNTRLHTRVQEIKKAAEKATRLTRQLLMFSRGEAVAPRILDMNRLVIDIESMVERLIGEHIILHIHLDPTISAIKADAGQLEQVLLNLVVNGRDAMPEGGTLDVTTRRVQFYPRQPLPHPEMRPGIYTELAVTDTGCGMSPETQRRIFEPFFTTKGPGKGTGLGLSTVFGIVKQNRGFIDVQSEIGEGTTFRLFFPALRDVAKSSESPGRALVAQKSGNETILLVEDEAQIREIIEVALEQAGYTVLSAGNGEEALALNQQHHGTLHLIITDVVMPGMNGTSLAEQLLANRPITKVLFISGYTDGEATLQQMVKEQQALLRKPFTPAILIDTVRSLLDNKSTLHSTTNIFPLD